MAHSLLSESIADLLTSDRHGGNLTVNRLIEHTGGRGIFLVMIFLCLPFVAPLSIPGVGVPLGTMVMLLGLQLALGRPPRLPAWVGEHALPVDRYPKIIQGSLRLLRFLEQGVRPRDTAWMAWKTVFVAHCLLISLLAFLLALPVPVWLSNTLPAYGIILIALSMMEQDGRMIWVGYLATLVNLAYFALVAELVLAAYHKHFQQMLHWLLSWL